MSGQPHNLRSCPGARVIRPRAGFTLVELLVVMAIIAILAAFVLPALSASKARGQQTVCVNNLKQLCLSSQMYVDDNGGKFADNVSLTPAVATLGTTNAWVHGNMMIANDATNVTGLRQGEVYPYLTQASVYKCPADLSKTNGTPRTRSYSMNGWIGSRTMNQPQEEPGYRTYVKESETALMGPANLWVIMDEHEMTIDDGWFLVTMNDTKPFASFPATHHQRGYDVNFADGHVEHVGLHDPGTVSPAVTVSSANTDWLHLKQITTTSYN